MALTMMQMMLIRRVQVMAPLTTRGAIQVKTMRMTGQMKMTRCVTRV